MRDASRIKEKFQLSLDGSQVAAVVVGAMVIVGAVFVLGLNVGKQLAVRQAPAAPQPAADPLAALDGSVAPEPKGPGPQLTYHDLLTRDQPKPKPAPKAPPAPAVVQAPARPEPPPPVPTPKPAPADPVPAARPAAAHAAAASDDSEEPEAKPATVKPERPAPAPTAAPERSFAIQVGASPDLAEANRIAERFKSYHPRIVAADVPNKGRWYRVRVGGFDSKDEANRYLQDLSRETGASGYVTNAK